MIKNIPGWANFIILVIFYVILAKGLLMLWALADKIMNPEAVKVLVLYAAMYLSKWSLKQGGGLTFW